MPTQVSPLGLDAGIGGRIATDHDPGFDPVLAIAGDRPSDSTLPALLDPAADHLDPRRDDVEEKHRRIVSLLDAGGFDAAILSRADTLAWLGAGGDFARDDRSDLGSVAMFVNRNLRAVLADNVQSARVFEEELAGLGFQLKERPWHADAARVIAELCHGRRVVSDVSGPGLIAEPRAIRSVRWPMTATEREHLRGLGRSLSLAVEATCRNFTPGETEADVAGHLAHRLLREGIVPVSLRVASDDRAGRFRRSSFKAASIVRSATIAAVGRRHGLCAAMTRTVSFGEASPALRDAHAVASMVDASCIYFSRPGEAVSEVFRRARRIYEKFDYPHEWTLDYQGSLIGYNPCEGEFRPDSPELLADGSALRWSPSVDCARSEDTVAIDARGFEVVTEAQDWPKVDVFVKGFAIPRPGVLER